MIQSPSQGMVIAIAFVIFLLIVFWRISIPLILAIVLAKVIVALASASQQEPAVAAAALLLRVPPPF
ncbi:hypothetical protein [Actinomycetospora aeridis]|uniref:Uncharacterized protein n=1 Tax=Actinomycetospora aeridis TaxID=3129231 RepID=A0ABU8N627_9PSEU